MEGTLVERRLKNGGSSWAVHVELSASPDGQRRQRWVSLGKNISKRAAQKRKRELLGTIDEGRFVENNRITVADLLTTWLEQTQPREFSEMTVSPKTHQEYVRIVRVHLVPALGTIRLTRLRPSHLAEAYAKFRESGRGDGRGLAGQTCLSIHRVLHRALNYGIRTLQVVKTNVAAQVEPPRPTERHLAPFDESQVRAVLEAARGTRYEVPLLVSGYTGIRRSEVLALRWSGVDLENGWLVVRESLEQTKTFGLRFKAPKSRASRRVLPLEETVIGALQQHRDAQNEMRETLGDTYQENDLLFPSPDGSPWPPSAFSSGFVHIALKAKVGPFRLHDLRHAFASIVLKAGTSVKEVQGLLGHSSAKLTLDTYAHVMEGGGREAVRRFGRALAEQPREGAALP